ncbi:MAG: hypothetical protein PUB98_07845, partial [Clostridiales bacterium]|nr:hypothetical protein [Clostridiales bacterium]
LVLFHFVKTSCIYGLFAVLSFLKMGCYTIFAPFCALTTSHARQFGIIRCKLAYNRMYDSIG